MFESESESNMSLNLKGPRTRFTFDSHAQQQHHTQVERQLKNLEERIKTLVNEATVGGLPIAEWILRSVPEPDPNELEFLGEALIRISKLLPTYTKLKSLLSFINYALNNPNEAMLAFADVSAIVDDVAAFLTKPNED